MWYSNGKDTDIALWILLTTTALVAFAGAAAADGHTSVSFAGEASAEYNSLAGYTTAAEVTATGSATLDNGLTASTSITIDGVAGTVSAGSVTLSSDTASLTFGTGMNGAVFTAVADDYDIGQAAEETVDGIVASATFGATTLVVSGEIAANAVDTTLEGIKIGVTTSAAGWNLGLGLVSATSEYAMTAAGTAGGADIGFGMSSDNEWDVSVAYPVGAVTVSASTDEDQAWTVGAAYAADGISAGFELSPASAWEITAGYEANGAVVAVTFADTNAMSLGATYDMGNGLTVGGGMETTAAAVTTNYAFGSYALGGGANAFVDYSDGVQVEVGPSERDIAEGTTVGVSFTF